MEYSFKVTVSVPNGEFKGKKPSKKEVCGFLINAVMLVGSGHDPDEWPFALYLAGDVTVGDDVPSTNAWWNRKRSA